MRKTLFETQVLTGFQYMEGVGYVVQIAPAPFELKAGETYIIELDGDREFPRTAFAFDSFAPGMVAVGNDYPVTGVADPDNLPVIVGYDPNENYVGFVALVTADELEIGIYQEVEEKIILRDPDGTEQEYPMRPMLEVDTTGGGTVLYSKGQILDGLTIQPDFSAGDMEITAPDGYLVQSAVIAKPENLKPENIREGENVAGIVGTHEGGGGAEMPCIFTAYRISAYRLASTSSSSSTKSQTVNIPRNSKVIAVISGGDYMKTSSSTGTYTNIVGAEDNLSMSGYGKGQKLISYTTTIQTSRLQLSFSHSDTCTGNYTYGTHLISDIVLFSLPGFKMVENGSRFDIIADQTVTELPPGAYFPRRSITRIDLSESVITELPYYFSGDFSGQTWLYCQELILPPTCTLIKTAALIGFNKTLDMSRATTVVNMSDSHFEPASGLQILVPAALYDDWIADSKWSSFADYIVPV